MKVHLVLTAHSSTRERAQGEQEIHWQAEMSRANFWWLIHKLCAVLLRCPTGRFYEPEAAKAEAVAPGAAGGGNHGDLQSLSERSGRDGDQ